MNGLERLHPQGPGVDWSVVTLRGSNRGVLIQINVHDLILSFNNMAHRERVQLRTNKAMSNRKRNMKNEWIKGNAQGVKPRKERVDESCPTSIQCSNAKTCSGSDNSRESDDVEVKWGPAKANVIFAKNGADAKPMTTKGGLVLATAGVKGTWVWMLLLLVLLSDTVTCTLFRILVM